MRISDWSSDVCSSDRRGEGVSCRLFYRVAAVWQSEDRGPRALRSAGTLRPAAGCPSGRSPRPAVPSCRLGFLPLGQLAHDHIAPERRQVIYERDAVQVIDLMLQAGCKRAVGVDLALGRTACWERVCQEDLLSGIER